MLTRSSFVAIIALLVVSGGPVSAGPPPPDSIGAPGKLGAITIHDDNSLHYSNKHGTIEVDQGGDGVQTYTWGGAKCSGKDLTEAAVQNLVQHVGNNKLRIVPRWLAGTGSTRCLVGYSLTRKKYLDDLEVP